TQWGLDLGFLEVEIEGDALFVIKKHTSKKEDRLEISTYIRSTRFICAGYQRCIFRHAPGEANRVAHILANE
ncbi:hypothetical protein Goklo_000747, partial [Gossypium klotzschianum]|nr:hypothetical protein [Gossypium klotzschianum]